MAATFYKTAFARKTYKCDWCFEPIEKGDGYARIGWADFQGSITERKYHLDCDKMSISSNTGDEDIVCEERHKRGEWCEH